MTDVEYLRQAISVGNQVNEPHNFGAVVVLDGVIVSSEHNYVATKNNPSLHSEVCAIASACQKLETVYLDGATLYCSHEPCVMCFSCAAWAHIERIVYATASTGINDVMYEFKEMNLQELSKKLHYPIKVEHLTVSV